MLDKAFQTLSPFSSPVPITDDLILDYDGDGKIVAITLDNHSKNVETADLQALGVLLLAA